MSVSGRGGFLVDVADIEDRLGGEQVEGSEAPPLLLGDLYLTLGERENALAAWGRALEADPADPDLLRGKFEREIEAAGRLVDESPARGRTSDAPPPR